MTSIEWLMNELQRLQYFIGNDMLYAYKQAEEMHKAEIIDAFNLGDYGDTRIAEHYYQKTFGSKGSDAKDVVLGYKTSLDAQMLDSQLPQQEISDGGKDTAEYIDRHIIESMKELAKEDFKPKLSEISDEEITKLANEHVLYNDSKRQWVIEGMKLYREQISLKADKK